MRHPLLTNVLRQLPLLSVLLFSPLTVAQDISSLVQAYEASLQQSAAAQQQAAVRVLEHYKEYKQLVAVQQVSRDTARALDEHLIRMTQDVWGEVAKRNPGLSYVVPVGTLGNRADPKYIPGKSDKDFIPRGTQATEAARDFTQAFERKYGIPAHAVDVNALDPTKIDTWPDRVIAAADFEKYNTRGGIAWLEREMHSKQPNLWQFHPESGRLSEVAYGKLVQQAPPPLTSADALGFHSDNLKFRNDLISKYSKNPADLALKQSKYDLRNVQAFGLAGGKLNRSEVELLNAAQMFRNGKREAAVGWIMQITGETDQKLAVEAYLKRMDALSARMSKEIVSKHVSLMSRQGSRELLDEMAAALHNLPPQYRKEVEQQVTRQLGRTKWNQISAMSEAFSQRLAGYELLDAAARSRYGKSLNELKASERRLLEEGLESAESFASRAARAAGITLAAGFAVYAVYDAYQQQEAAGGSGAAAAAGRVAIELIQLGYPPLAVAELLGRLGAGVVDLGISAYRDDALDALYAQYLSDPARDVELLLNTYGVDRYSAGALRQLAIEMRLENPLITDSEIDERIRSYFTRRAALEQQGQEFKALAARAETWIDENEIPLAPGGDWLSARFDNQRLRQEQPEQYYQLLGALLQHYHNIRERLRRGNQPFTENDIWYELYLIYRGYPINPADFAGTWTNGQLVFVDMPILDMLRAEADKSRPAQKSAEALEGCDLSPEMMQAMLQSLQSLKGRPLELRLTMTCHKDPATGTGSFQLIPPADLGSRVKASEPVTLNWRFTAPSQLDVDGAPQDGLQLKMTAEVQADAQQYQLSGTWQAFPGQGERRSVLLSGTWKATKPRGARR